MNKNDNKNLHTSAVEYHEVFSDIHIQLNKCEETLREIRNQFIFDNQLCEEFRNSYNHIVRARDHIVTLLIHSDPEFMNCIERDLRKERELN